MNVLTLGPAHAQPFGPHIAFRLSITSVARSRSGWLAVLTDLTSRRSNCIPSPLTQRGQGAFGVLVLALLRNPPEAAQNAVRVAKAVLRVLAGLEGCQDARFP